MKENQLLVSLDIENVSDLDGCDVIQVYVGKRESNIYRPLKELKGFAKVSVPAHTTKNCVVEVNIEDLSSFVDAITEIM